MRCGAGAGARSAAIAPSAIRAMLRAQLEQVKSWDGFLRQRVTLDAEALVPEETRSALAALPTSVRLHGDAAPLHYEMEDGVGVVRLHLREGQARRFQDRDLPPLDRPVRFAIVRARQAPALGATVAEAMRALHRGGDEGEEGRDGNRGRRGGQRRGSAGRKAGQGIPGRARQPALAKAPLMSPAVPLALVIVQVLFASLAIAGRYVLPEFPAGLLVTVRVLGAAAVLLAVNALARRPLGDQPARPSRPRGAGDAGDRRQPVALPVRSQAHHRHQRDDPGHHRAGVHRVRVGAARAANRHRRGSSPGSRSRRWARSISSVPIASRLRPTWRWATC